MSKYWDKKLRDREIVKLAAEMSVEELAKKFGVSQRTIQRTLRKGGQSGTDIADNL